MDESSTAKDSLDTVTDALTRTLIADRYRVLRVLGEGSSGIVYLCEHTALEKEVAVKVLHRELADNAALVARFTREAQTAARLDHLNSVHVMDFGQDRDGTLYLVMEYVEGSDLAELLAQNLQLSDERIVHYMTCILSALSAAHALGIVHRDLKPENVLVRVHPSSFELDVVKVCDFGVAQFSPVRLARNNNIGPTSTQTRRVTGDGMMVGTPWYMSPEQARAETLDARSDIYSAGVVLFQLLTRTLPFVGDDVMAVALAHCTTPPPPPSGYRAVHPGLEAVCLKALSKTPDLRYQSATEMLTALQDAVATRSVSRSLARVGRSSSTSITLAPVTVRAERLATTTLKSPTQRKVRPSLLIAGVATTLIGVAAVPRFLPSQHAVNAISDAATRSAHKLEQVIGRKLSPPTVDGVSIEDDPSILQPAEAALADPDALTLLEADSQLLASMDMPFGMATPSADGHSEELSALIGVAGPKTPVAQQGAASAAPVAQQVAAPAAKPAQVAATTSAASAKAASTPATPAQPAAAKAASTPAAPAQPAAAKAAPTPVAAAQPAAAKPAPTAAAPASSVIAALSSAVASPAQPSAATSVTAMLLAAAAAQGTTVATATAELDVQPTAAAEAPSATTASAAPELASGSTKAAAVDALPSEPQVGTVGQSEALPETPGEAAASAATIALSTLPQPAPAPSPAPKTEAKPAPAAPIQFKRIEINTDRLPPGVPRGVLRSALNPPALLACYTQAQQRAPQLELSGTALELKTNTIGRIVWTHVTNGELPASLRECLEQAVRAGKLSTAEGGEAHATVTLLPLP